MADPDRELQAARLRVSTVSVTDARAACARRPCGERGGGVALARRDLDASLSAIAPRKKQDGWGARGAKGSWTTPGRQQAARRTMQVPLSQTGTSSPSLQGRKRLPRTFLGRAMGEPASLTQQSSSDAHGTGSIQT
jgi:hypothetical protein